MLKNLKLLREEIGTTQKQLADAVGVSQQSINKYENHNIEPDIETMIKISDYFRTSVDYLVGNTSIRRKVESTQLFELNEQEQAVILHYRNLSKRKQSSIHEILQLYNE